MLCTVHYNNLNQINIINDHKLSTTPLSLSVISVISIWFVNAQQICAVIYFFWLKPKTLLFIFSCWWWWLMLVVGGRWSVVYRIDLQSVCLMSLMIYIDHIKCCLHRGGEGRSDCNVLYKSRAQHVLQWPLLSRDPREFICLLWLHICLRKTQ